MTAPNKEHQEQEGASPTLAWFEKYERLLLLCIPALAFLVYANAMRNPFAYDDESFILALSYYKNLANIPLLFSRQYHLLTAESGYRPLSVLPFFFSYRLFGLNPAGWRLYNLLLHGVNGMLVYLTIKTLAPKRRIAAFLAGLFFVVHPIFSETINVVGFNDDIQALTFFLVSLVIYVMVSQGRLPGKAIWLSVASFVAALLSKETTMVLPAILAAYELIKNKRDWPTIIKRQASYWIIAMAYLFSFLTILKNPHVPNRPYLGGSFYTGVINACRLLLLYIRLMIAPIHQTIFHDYYPSVGMTVEALAAIAAAAGLLAYVVYLYRSRKRVEFLGILIFLLTIIPVLDIIPFVFQVAERYLYLPMAGGFIFVAIIASKVWARLRRSPARPSIAGATLILALTVVLSFATIGRNRVFSSPLRLWQEAAANAPDQPLALNNLAAAYSEAGLLDQAEQTYRKAVAVNPRVAQTYVDFALLKIKMNDLGGAKQLLLTAVSRDQNKVDALVNLGNMLNQEGDPNTSLRYTRRALALEPYNVIAHMVTGASYEIKRMPTLAAEHYRRAGQIDPDFADAKINLNRLLDELRNKNSTPKH